MLFGLVNAPSTFQRAMSVALQGCEEFAVVYLDDILVFSESRSKHLCYLDCVFGKLKEAGYYVRLPKCSFLQQKVSFLGHTISKHGISPAENHEDSLSAFQPPFKTAKQAKSFLGLVMWFKSFIPHLATIAAPLFPLTSSRNTEVKWCDEATQAVEKLKAAILSAPTLARYDASKETRVTMDASALGLGAVLEQKQKETWHPVAF